MSTPLEQLALSWLPDDSFYYLQTAWQSRGPEGFTFDGESTTYGFQPLWMILLSILARLLESKEVFLRSVCLLSGVFYCATAAAMWAWTRRALAPWRGLIAPALWLLNPPMLHMCTSGKETALYAFLTVMCLWMASAAREKGTEKSSRSLEKSKKNQGLDFILGCLGGLLLLSRMNALLFLFLLLLWLALFSRYPSRERFLQVARVSLATMAIALPWFIYARVQYGVLMPTSGSRKLIGAWAGLAQAARDTLPFLPESFVTWPLPPVERAIFLGQEASGLPPVRFMLEQLFLAPLQLALQYWLPWDLLQTDLRGARDGLALALLISVLVEVLLRWSTLLRSSKGNGQAAEHPHRPSARPDAGQPCEGPASGTGEGPGSSRLSERPGAGGLRDKASSSWLSERPGAGGLRDKAGSSRLSERPGAGGLRDKASSSRPGDGPSSSRIHSSFALLGVWAGVNALVNGLLLPRYLEYAFWYRVPEALFFIVALANVCSRAMEERRFLLRWIVSALLLLNIAMNARAFVLFSTGSWTPPPPTHAADAWEALGWIEEHIPPSENIGAWNAGLLAYFVEGRTVINLDGLANSPEFLEKVVVPDIIEGGGRSSGREMWGYLQEKEIRWLADAELPERLETGPFFGVVPRSAYHVRYRGTRDVDWGDGGRLRRFAIVEVGR